MATTVQKTVRVTQKQWDRVKNAIENQSVSPNQLLVELAMEALDRREWPRTESEIRLLRSALFSAQAIARYMIDHGRKDEVEEIRLNISQFVPSLPD